MGDDDNAGWWLQHRLEVEMRAGRLRKSVVCERGDNWYARQSARFAEENRCLVVENARLAIENDILAKKIAALDAQIAVQKKRVDEV